jgi:hypothetical protein
MKYDVVIGQKPEGKQAGWCQNLEADKPSDKDFYYDVKQ